MAVARIVAAVAVAGVIVVVVVVVVRGGLFRAAWTAQEEFQCSGCCSACNSQSLSLSQVINLVAF